MRRKHNNKDFSSLLNQYDSYEELGSGGNGVVFRVEKGDTALALKILSNTQNRKALSRFSDEVSVLAKNTDIDGIIPIKESVLPPLNDGQLYAWYTMPIAMPASARLNSLSVEQKVQSIIDVAETLVVLHSRGISHRDIKVPNLLFWSDRLCLSDFGLVDFPDKKDVTTKWESVGPKWTIAPEMKRNAKTANGIPADVYSFAKTLWIILTQIPTGFEGQYAAEGFNSLRRHIRIKYSKPLDDLLTLCTDDNPATRPTISEVATELRRWVELESDYRKRNPLEWADGQRAIFPVSIPNRAIWEETESIILTLKAASKHNLNHAFFPDGGGADLIDIKKSFEENCIELRFDCVSDCIVKPSRLYFESFSYTAEWNYFRLDCEPLSPIDTAEGDNEYLTELRPGVYTDPNCYDYNDYNGSPLPDGARPIRRLLSGGSFVIFQKTSFYNAIPQSYNGDHNKVSADRFRESIKQAVERIREKEKPPVKHNEYVQPEHVVPTEFMSQSRFLTEPELKILKKVMVAATERDNEEENIRNESGLGTKFSWGQDGTEEYLDAERPAESRFEGMLKSMNNRERALIGAVMYAGRDDEPPFWGRPLDARIEEFLHDDYVTESITGKTGVVQYLEKGIELYTPKQTNSA